jgi:hypothetical protein
MPDRYVVRELEGFLTHNGWRNPGLSVVVLDSRICYRIVREFQSESIGRAQHPVRLTRDAARARTRKQATELAARLNEATP